MKKIAIIFMFVFLLAACSGKASIDTPTEIHITPNPTQIISATQIGHCNDLHLFESKTSPNGNWMAVPCDDGGVFRLYIVKIDATKEWQVSFKDLTNLDSLGYERLPNEMSSFPSVPLPYRWDKESRYLFIAPQVIVDGNTSDGFGLYRFDVDTGKISILLPFANSSYNFAFSPNDAMYVYFGGTDEKNIHIVSIQTGKEQSIPVPSQQGSAENFLWSSDNKNFVFIYVNKATEKSSLLLFDTAQKVYSTLLEDNKLNLIPIRWESNLQVVLQENIWQGQQYLLNIETKELQAISTQVAP